MMNKPGWLSIATALVASLTLSACGIEVGNSDDDKTSTTTTPTTAQTPTATATPSPTATTTVEETATPEPTATVSDRDEKLTSEAQGTGLAFIDAVKEEDKLVFCGLVNPNFLAKFLSRSIGRAECIDFMGRKEWKAFQDVFEDAELGEVKVDYPLAYVMLETGPDKASVAVLRRNKSARWVIRDLIKPEDAPI